MSGQVRRVLVVVNAHPKMVRFVMWYPLHADNRHRQRFLVRNNVTQPQPPTQLQPQLQPQRQLVIHVPEFVLAVVGVRDYVSTDTMKLVPLGF